jgi:CDP-4-dehydro-6-deoxyglucose reductase
MSCRACILSRAGQPVQRIVLRMPGDFSFRTGQYLEVLHPEGPIPLSIASAPRRLPELHLHYLSLPGAPEAARMDELLDDDANVLEVRGPGGDVDLPNPLPAPALIVAGGTGIAQAMSFIDTFTAADPGAPVTLLWCADTEADFYLRDELRALDAPWLETVLIADAERSSRNRGLVWLRQHGSAFAGNDPPCPVVLAGGPGFVYAACDTLLAVGITAAQIQSDVFSYAPRA